MKQNCCYIFIAIKCWRRTLRTFLFDTCISAPKKKDFFVDSCQNFLFQENSLAANEYWHEINTSLLLNRHLWKVISSVQFDARSIGFWFGRTQFFMGLFFLFSNCHWYIRIDERKKALIYFNYWLLCLMICWLHRSCWSLSIARGLIPLLQLLIVSMLAAL